MKEFEENNNSQNIPKFLIGNKSDLEHLVTQDSIDKLAKEAGIQYFSTSAKDGSNIDEMFQTLSESMYENSVKKPKGQKNVKLSECKEKTPKKECICTL